MKLNNKGYLIVEVILAGVLTFTMAYFLINLTLKIRNRYDDANVETVMLNDKTVITNEIMGDVVNNKITNVENITNGIKINFEDGSSKELTIVNNTITYGTYTKKFSENAIVGNVSIRRNGNYFLIEIPVTTKYSDKDYGINIVGFTKEAAAPLTCTLSRSDTEIIASFDGNMVYYGWDANYSGDNSTSKSISLGKHTYYIKDAFGNTGSCSIEIAPTAISCSLSANASTITASFSGNMAYYGWSSSYSGDNSTTKTTSVGDHIYYIKDNAGNTGSCNISIINTTKGSYTDCGGNLHDSGGCYYYTGATVSYSGQYYCKRNSGTGNLVQYNCAGSGGPSCPSGYTLFSNRCSGVYSCSRGYLVNKSCKIYTSGTTVTTYSCAGGYTKINDNYCYK